jgi:hypothetical protein
LRKATFAVAAGDTAGMIGGQSSMTLQTGTTAGTIVITSTLPSSTQQAALVIAPTPVIPDSTSSVLRFGEVDASLNGFDNTYSASIGLRVLKHDRRTPVGRSRSMRRPACISTSSAPPPPWGAFGLPGRFLATGNTAQVGVDVQITNTAEVPTARRIPVGN